MSDVHVVPSDVHVTDGTDCFCNCLVLEGEGGNIIIHEETAADA